ncbi:putative porin [Blattabacterium cuenoti]|uniref:putative porin n=1 Tax=Blattabacterium cuenoti TaxID=1653831 RepID=UPI00163CA17C|nr:putative porin [Blattabacterium cuenoti]
MKIFIFTFLFIGFYVSSSMEIKTMDPKNFSMNIYHSVLPVPLPQDYKYWTEENPQKKNLDITSLSIKKYYSHNFFRQDNFGSFQYQEKEIFIPSFDKDPNEFFSREKIRYFDVKTPLSEIFYIRIPYKILGGFFTQSPNKKTNYSMEYRNLFFQKIPKIEKHNSFFLITFTTDQSHFPYHYKLWGHYLYKNFYRKKETKKIFWNTTDNVNSFQEKNNFFYQRMDISFLRKIFPFSSWIKLENGKSFFLKTHIEYTKYFKTHFSSKKDFTNNMINISYLKNECFLILNQKKSNIEIGVSYDKIRSQLFSNHLFYKVFMNLNKKENLNTNRFTMEAKVNYLVNKMFKFHSNGKWMIENGDKFRNYLQANIQLDTIFFPEFHLLTNLNINNNIFPSFINSSLFQRDNNCYNRKKNNIVLNTKSIDFFLFYKNMDCSLKISQINRPYQNDNKNLLYWKYISSCIFKIGVIHHLWKLQFNHIILCQKQNSDQLIFSIPNFLSRNTISYKDYYFHQALLIQTGFSIHYFSKFFYQNSSYPFDLFYFYLENECLPKKIGGSPFIDYFLNFKLFRTNFYASIQNIGFPEENQKTKQPNLFIKIGLLWNLFT